MAQEETQKSQGGDQQPWDDSGQLPTQFLAMRRKQKRIKRVKYAVAAVVVVAAVGAGGYVLTHGSSQDDEQPTTQTYTQAVEKGTLSLSVEGSGTLAASSTTNANASVSGTVKKVYVTQGDTVKKGDVLFTLSSDTLSDAVDTASTSKSKAYSSYSSSLSDLSSAKSKLAKAKKAYAAAKKKAKKAQKKSAKSSGAGGEAEQNGSGSGSSSSDSTSALQTAQEAMTQAQQSVTQAKSAVEQAKESYDEAVDSYDDAVEALDDLTVKASSAGTVTAVNVTKGDTVSDSSDTAAVTISDLNKMSLSLSVSEYDIGNIKTGQKATVTVTALSKDVKATVTSVSSSASESQDGSTAYYSVTLEIKKPSSNMLEGMSATAKVVYQSYEDALLVPASAVSTQGDSSSVTVQGNDGSTRQVQVELLGSDDETAAVSSDSLAEGDQVVVSYQVDTGDSNSNSGSGSAAGIMGMASSGGDAGQGGGDASGGNDGGQGGGMPGGGQGGSGGGDSSGSAPTPPSGGGQGGGMPSGGSGSGSSQG